MTAVYLINRIPSVFLKNQTPYQKLFDKIPAYSHLRTFGCLTYASTLAVNRTKFCPRANSYIFVGYPPNMKAYKLFDLTTNEFIISRDVVFHETIFPFQKDFQKGPEDPFAQIVLPVPTNDQISDATDDSHFQIPNSTLPMNSDGGSSPDTSNQHDPAPNSNQHHRRTTRVSKPPSYLRDFHCNSVSTSNSLYPLAEVVNYDNLSSKHKNLVINISSNFEPRHYNQAMKFPQWCAAMDDELKAMNANQTWSIVPLPHNKNTVGCRWVYKIKYGSNGNIERHKARLVAKGFSQQEGVDFFDTYTPVAKLVTVKTLLAIAAAKFWNLVQLDVNNAFLNGDLKEEVYMDLPPGFKIKGEHSSNQKLVCKLHKSIYGLRQASRQWFEKFSSFMLHSGFSQSKSDYSLFFKGNGSDYIALLVYVDDILITGSSATEIDSIKRKLSNKFKLKDLGNLGYFLGLEVARSKAGIFVSQRNYTLQLIEDLGLLGAKPATTPMDPRVNLHSDMGNLYDDPSRYRRLIGRLLYLNITRPDISFSIQKLSQYVSSPRTPHFEAACHLVRYLKQSPGQGIFLSATSTLNLRAFSDSDWGKCLDSRKSVTGYCVFLGDSLISWKSKMQPTVSRSSAEAEYRAIASTTCELIWLKQLLRDFGIHHSHAALLFCDNDSAIKIANNPTFHERTKHIEIDLHFVRDKVVDKTIRLMPIRTQFQLVDLFTKPLPATKLIPFMSKMSLQNIYSPISS